MLAIVDLATRPNFAIRIVTCQGEHAGWSEPETRTEYLLVLVRRGRFRRRAGGETAEVDPTVAYIGFPEQEEDFAHPAGGDICTAVTLSPSLWCTLAGDKPALARSTVYVDARLDAAHRRCLAAAQDGDVDFAVAQELLPLLGAALDQVAAAHAPPDGRVAAGNRALVAEAREAIISDHSASRGLFPLADLVGASPYRLSRAFTRELGVSVTHYRNRVRVGRALDRLEQGESSLADLAADLGFADQAHLSRTVRAHVGRTPAALRRLLKR